MNYSEQLKDPKWQRKRLTIFTRDNWTCQKCGNEKETLHVHHNYYAKGKKPWEYPDSDLVTLCETCHSGKHTDGTSKSDFEADFKRYFLSTCEAAYDASKSGSALSDGLFQDYAMFLFGLQIHGGAPEECKENERERFKILNEMLISQFKNLNE